MTANDAQDQHLKTHGLVKEYQGTALHVVKTMLPIVEIGVKKKKPALVEKALNKVCTYVEDMIKRTDKTVTEYYRIKEEVSKEINIIGKKNKDIKTRESEIEVEMKEKRLLLKFGEKDLMDLKSKTEEKEQVIQKMQTKREKYVSDSVQSYGSGDTLKEILTTGLAFLGIIARGAEAGKTIYEGARTATTERKEQASKQALEASEVTKKDIEKEQDKVEYNEKRIAKMNEEAIARLTAMEKLALENADQMNEESLKLASSELGKVAQLFAKILLFWENFHSKLTTLSKSKDGIETFIDSFDDSDLREEIDESVNHVKAMWNSFGIMCTTYVDKSEKQLPELYDFMSTPIDQKAIEECNRRKRELLEGQRAEIRELEKNVL